MNNSSASTAILRPSSFWRGGNLLLWGGLTLSLLLTLLLASTAPAAIPVIPILLIGGCIFAVLVKHPAAHLTVLLASSVVLANYTPGFQIEEVVYAIYYVAYLACWYYTYFLNSTTPLVNTTTDGVVVFFLIWAGTFGVAAGYWFGGSLSSTISEAVALSFIGFYFPIKKLCRTYRYGPQIVAGLLIWFSIFFTFTHVLEYYSDITSAQHLWQIGTTRFYGRELPLLIGALMTLVASLHFRSTRRRAASIALFAIFFASLILTQSRGYWLNFLLGLGFIFLFQNKRDKIRIITITSTLFCLFILISIFLFGDFAFLALSTLIERFASIQSSLTEDISLINRYYEARAVWENIVVNPVVGYGLGNAYITFDIIRDIHMVKSFTHNGVLSLWYRLGLVGLGSILFVWGASIYHGGQIVRNASLSRNYCILALIAVVCLIAIIPASNTSNPFHRSHEILTFTILVSWVSGLKDIYRIKKISDVTA